MAGDSTAGAPKRPPTAGTARPRHPQPETAAPGTARPGATRTRAIPAQARASHSLGGAEGLVRFNAAPAGAAEAALLACCGSRRWARRIAAHRPYPTLDALLAAADEAGYDLVGADLDEALADETSFALPPGTHAAAHLAWDAARTAYEDRFRHAFVICLDGHRPEEYLDQALAGIRSRLGNQRDEERAIAADELRRLARARLSRLIGRPGPSGSPSVPV